MTPRPHRQSATAPPVAAAAEMVVSMANGAKKEAAAAANTTAAADADGGRGAAPTLHGLHPSSSTSSPRCTASAGNAPSTSSARRGDIKNGAAGRQGAEVRMRNTEASAPVAATEGCGRQEPAAAPAVKIPVTFYQMCLLCKLWLNIFLRGDWENGYQGSIVHLGSTQPIRAGDQEVNLICANSRQPRDLTSGIPLRMATSHSHRRLLPISDAPSAASPSTATPSSGCGCRGWPFGEEQRRRQRLPLPIGAPHRRYTFTSTRHLAQSGDVPSTFNHTATAPEIFHLHIVSFKKIRNLKGKWTAPLIDIQPRQKQVIAEWRKTVRPLIWQCRTLELHMKDISSQMAQSFESSFLHSSLFSSPPQLGNNSTGHHGAEWKYQLLAGRFLYMISRILRTKMDHLASYCSQLQQSEVVIWI